MPQKSPAFQFYPLDYLGDIKVKLMTNRERGIYVTLLCHCWLEKSLPKDLSSLSSLAGEDIRDFEVAWNRTIKKCFKGRGSRLFHSRLNRERLKQVEYSRQQQENINKRWDMEKKRKSTTVDKPYDGNTMVLPSKYRRNTLQSSSSSSSSSSKQFIRPTHQEVTIYAESISFALDAQRFLDFYDSKGWMIGKNKMKDWRAAIRTWKGKERENGATAGRASEPGNGAGHIPGKYAQRRNDATGATSVVGETKERDPELEISTSN